MDMPLDEQTNSEIEREIARILQRSAAYEMVVPTPLWKLVLAGAAIGLGLPLAGIFLIHAIMQALH